MQLFLLLSLHSEHTWIHSPKYRHLLERRKTPGPLWSWASSRQQATCTFSPCMHREHIYYVSSERFCLCWCSHLKIQVLCNNFESFFFKEGRETRPGNTAMQVMDFRFDHLQGGDGGHGYFILKRNSKLDESVVLSGEECWTVSALK